MCAERIGFHPNYTDQIDVASTQCIDVSILKKYLFYISLKHKDTNMRHRAVQL